MASQTRIVFDIINILYLLITALLAAGGIFFFLHLQELTNLRNFERHQLDTNVHWPEVIPWVFVAVFIIVLFTSCCGFSGAHSGSKGLLITYNIFLTFLLLLSVAIGVLAMLVARKDSDTFIRESTWDVFNEARAKPRPNPASEGFGRMESLLHCCGAEGPNDYVVRLMDIPVTCCDDDRSYCGSSERTSNPRRGCIEVAKFYTKIAFIVGTAGSGLVAVLCVVSLVLAGVMLRRIGRDSKITT